jgi:hypothetical protein
MSGGKKEIIYWNENDTAQERILPAVKAIGWNKDVILINRCLLRELENSVTTSF